MTQIRYVLTAAERLNFTKAAADCGVSQPALTKGIKALDKLRTMPEQQARDIDDMENLLEDGLVCWFDIGIFTTIFKQYNGGNYG